MTFRNVDVDPDTPVARWLFEAIVAVVERGTIGDWARLTSEIDRDPWGPVARQIEDYLRYERPWGVAPLLERAIAGARLMGLAGERQQVAQSVAALVERSGLGLEEFASRIGTSRSRLSTYRSGSVTPSASLLLRMEAVVERLNARDPDPGTVRHER